MKKPTAAKKTQNQKLDAIALSDIKGGGITLSYTPLYFPTSSSLVGRDKDGEDDGR